MASGRTNVPYAAFDEASSQFRMAAGKYAWLAEQFRADNMNDGRLGNAVGAAYDDFYKAANQIHLAMLSLEAFCNSMASEVIDKIKERYHEVDQAQAAHH